MRTGMLPRMAPPSPIPLFPPPPPRAVKEHKQVSRLRAAKIHRLRLVLRATHSPCAEWRAPNVGQTQSLPSACPWLGWEDGTYTVQCPECCHPRLNTKARAPCLGECQEGLPREVRLELGLEQGSPAPPHPTPHPGGHAPDPGLRLWGTSRSFICCFPTTRITTWSSTPHHCCKKNSLPQNQPLVPKRDQQKHSRGQRCGDGRRHSAVSTAGPSVWLATAGRAVQRSRMRLERSTGPWSWRAHIHSQCVEVGGADEGED